MSNDSLKPVTMTLTLGEFEKSVAALVAAEKYITACLILRKLGYSMEDAIAYYKALPEYKENKTNRFLVSVFSGHPESKLISNNMREDDGFFWVGSSEWEVVDKTVQVVN